MAPRFRHHFSGAAALLSSLSSCLCRSSRAKLKRPKIIISDVELNKCMFYKRSTVSNTNAKRVVVDIAPSHLRPNQGPQEGVQNWLVKFGHSEKNTKFEKIFHLKGVFSKPSGNCIIAPIFCFLSQRLQIVVTCLFFDFL